MIKIFHGSDHIIKSPDFNKGNIHNDYGKGFYCTRDEERAKEWACKNKVAGFVNIYDLDDKGLKSVNLLDGKYSVLNWIALLLKNRTFTVNSEIAIEAKEYIIENFSVDLTDCDIVVGYRADDSYFRYAEAFISNTLPVRSLNKALYLGRLGEQIVIVSENGFNRISFDSAYQVDSEVYYQNYYNRDIKARNTFRNDIKKSKTYRDDIFVLDILREEIRNDDPRIQRIISD